MHAEQTKELRVGAIVKATVDAGARIENCIVLFVEPDTGNVGLILGDRLGKKEDHIPYITKTPPEIMEVVGHVSLVTRR
jgi:hypothetical protein